MDANLCRYDDTPLRVQLSGDDSVLFSTVNFASDELELLMSPDEIDGNIENIIFGVPNDNNGGMKVLSGWYTLNVKALMFDPEDSIEELK